MSRAMIIATLFLLLAPAHSAPAQQNLPAPLRDVGFDQRLDQQIPLDLQFTDESGRLVKLGDYFHGKPVILVLAYYRCPMLCTLVLNGLTQGLLEMDFDIGSDFQVVTVSFDPRETPQMAAAKKQTYLKRYRRPGAAEGWHFLTGEPTAIKRLADAIGFRYVYDPLTDQFAHASGLTILTPQGKISRYFYDVQFPGRDLRLGLVDAGAGTIGTPIDQILLFCFHYDPAAGKYGPAIVNVLRLGGLLTVIAIVALVGCLRMREARLRPLTPREPVR